MPHELDVFRAVWQWAADAGHQFAWRANFGDQVLAFGYSDPGAAAAVVMSDDLLNDMIEELRDKLKDRTLAFKERMQVNALLLKAFGMKQRSEKKGKRKGFDLRK